MGKQPAMTPREIEPGRWAVYGKDGELLKDGFTSNAQAWDWIDVHDLRPVWRDGNRHWWGH
jgi:hypothetical protein